MRVRGLAVPWWRLLAEGAAIVLSILLAFSIDAWWDGRREYRREQALLAGLLEDFRSSRPDLESRLALARRMAQGTSGFLQMVSGGVPGETLTVPDALILATLGGPTYEPSTNTLDAALAAGEIELLSDQALRSELATWRRTLSDTREDELEVRRVTNEQLVPLLARSIDVGPYFDEVLAWSGGDPHGAGRLIEAGPDGLPGSATVAASNELAGALALRKFYVEFAAADLEELLSSLDRSVGLLQRQLEHHPANDSR
jgi:hypothetical protein